MSRDFLLLLQGRFISRLGSNAFTIALVLWAKHTTESSTIVGLFMMSSALPSLILGPLGGIVADRYSRKRTIVIGDLAKALAVLMLVGIVSMQGDSGNVVIVAGLATSLIISVVGAFYGAATAAIVPDLVSDESLEKANGFNQGSSFVAKSAGQSVGGVVFSVLGATTLFALNAISYVYSALSAMMIRTKQTLPDGLEGWSDRLRVFWREGLEGVRMIREDKCLKAVIVVALSLNFFVWPIVMLLPFYVEDFLGLGAEWYGFLVTANGLGATVGYVVAGAKFVPEGARANVVLLLLFLQATGMGLLVTVGGALPALCGLTVLGAMGGMVSLTLTTELQRSIPSAIRGRIFGLMGTASNALSPVAIAVTGVMGDWVDNDVGLIYPVCGASAAIFAAGMSVNTDFRRFLGVRDRPLEAIRE